MCGIEKTTYIHQIKPCWEEKNFTLYTPDQGDDVRIGRTHLPWTVRRLKVARVSSCKLPTTSPHYQGTYSKIKTTLLGRRALLWAGLGLGGLSSSSCNSWETWGKFNMPPKTPENVHKTASLDHLQGVIKTSETPVPSLQDHYVHTIHSRVCCTIKTYPHP